MSAKKKPAVKPAPVLETEVVEVVLPEPAVPPQYVRAEAGDNYLTIAERWGLNAHDLHELNAGAPIRDGSRIRLS